MVATQTSIALAADALSLTYPNGAQALDGVSLAVTQGEFLAIIGPNGSGKSSLLRGLAGLQKIDAGTVRVNGRAVGSLSARERAREIAHVPQALDVLPGYSVEDFVLMGRYAHLDRWRLYSRRDREIAHENLRRVEALEFLERGMAEMSGGERQRVLIARALTQEAQAILLDEPTSALDLKHQMRVYHLIREMHSAGRTVVVVTHDLNLASQFAGRLVLMQQGRIVKDGNPGEVLRPEVLEPVYETPMTYGNFESTVAGAQRPWVLPWAKKS